MTKRKDPFKRENPRWIQFKVGVGLAWDAIKGTMHVNPPLNAFDYWWINENIQSANHLKEIRERLNPLVSIISNDGIREESKRKIILSAIDAIHVEEGRIIQHSSPLIKSRDKDSYYEKH